MILLIDNYDSFSYNLYQYIGELNPDVVVKRNDEITIEEIEKMEPDCIILSPGPGRPENAGIIVELVQKLGNRFPILGICLGHQAIAQAYGAEIVHASRLMHGKKSEVEILKENELFKGVTPEDFQVGRYHSLSVNPDSLPEELEVSAVADDGEIMAIKHRDYPVYGLQFHPESILTPDGKRIIKNFLEICQ